MIDASAYLAALQQADVRAATTAMQQALRRGVGPDRWIREVVVPAQRIVGERWFDGTWSVADEHAATAVAEQALTLLRPLDDWGGEAPRVMFACAEGEWHTFPARLAAEVAAIAGVRTIFLGASVPSEHLSRRLAASAPDVLALSCTMPTNLIAAWRSITAAHELGIPVAVGGRGWGSSGRRASALGADCRPDDASDLVGVTPAFAAPSVQLPAEALLLELPDHEVLLLALERQTAASTWMRGLSSFQRRATLEDLGWQARHAAAAVATGDATIVTELLDWLVALLMPRGVPMTALTDSCLYLADALEPTAPLAAEVLRSEAGSARERHVA